MTLDPDRGDRGDLRSEAKAILRLSGPLMAAQGGLMAMGVVDTLIVGRTGALEMASVALGNAVVACVLVLGLGAGMGIEPLVSQAHGARDPEAARSWLWQGVYLAAIAGLPLAVLAISLTFLFEPAGIEPAIASRTTEYLLSRMPGFPLHVISVVFRAYLSSVGRTRPILLAVIAANVLNAVLDLVLVFGWWGAPKLGAVGAGLATSACVLLLLLLWGAAALVDVRRRTGRDSGALFDRPRAERAKIAEVFRLGWPVGTQAALEVGVFTAVSALIGRIGAAPLAGHQVAITLASLTFMCAFGIANATTARVGYHIGARNSAAARRAGFLGIAVGGTFMGAGGLVFELFPEALTRMFNEEPEVLSAAITLIRIAGAFAISDGIQVVAAGALRGAGDTRWPFFANLIAHWAIGLPVALWLGSGYGLGAAGYWWGLTAGLTAVALALAIRFAVLSARPMVRLDRGVAGRG